MILPSLPNNRSKRFMPLLSRPSNRSIPAMPLSTRPGNRSIGATLPRFPSSTHLDALQAHRPRRQTGLRRRYVSVYTRLPHRRPVHHLAERFFEAS